MRVYGAVRQITIMKNIFIRFLMSLAQEGETLLLVKQKPLRPEQHYKDGSVKCAWPAFLPEFYDSRGSWFANTALFNLESMGSKVSASIVHAKYCCVLMLDDIGTKSKTPLLQPTWIMETSPGNFQWGYVFSHQPTTGEFAAAIKAIAAAGYTDPGAINPVRNFRLPNSINLKNNFYAVLTEFHPDRDFTLPEICKALGVIPGPADTAVIRAIKLDDDGGDDVLAWLGGRGDVLEQINSSGWLGVLCPNAVEHSDGNPSGRYAPLNRAYKCLHGHCSDWDSRKFLTWVAEQGGPNREHGLRENILVKSLSTALAKIAPPLKKDTTVEESDARETFRTEMFAWWTRFAYVVSDDAFFDVISRHEVPRSTFNALFRHIDCRSVNTRRKVEASIAFDEGRDGNGAPKVLAITYAAGENVILKRDGELYGNRWCNARPVVAAGDVTMWLDHCRKLVPNPDELDHILNAMAFKVKHPEIKINHAILHGGLEGCGKDTMWAPFIWAVCGPNLKNRGIMDNETISSQWGYQLESEVLIINELREPDAAQRRAFANKLKPIIASPPEMLPVNRKGLHPYMMLNRIFVLAFSNDMSPISLASQDRRWFCVWSHCARMDTGDAKAMWAWYENGGYEAVGAFLQTRNAKFNPAAPPPMTEFKQNLIEHGMSTAESVLVDLMKSRRGEFAAGVIAAPFHVVCGNMALHMPAGVKVPQAALFHALQEAGWKDMGRLSAVGLTSSRHVYCAPELAHYSKSDLRRMCEKPFVDLRAA